MVEAVFSTNTIHDNCIEDDVVVNENMIVTALMELAVKNVRNI